MVKAVVYEIDSEHPVPTGRATKYPFSLMEVGDSFVLPISKRHNIQARISKIKKETGKVFVIRKMSPTTCRVWRKA